MPKAPTVLKVKPVPVPAGYDHPEPPNELLPKHEFTLGLIAYVFNNHVNILLPTYYNNFFHLLPNTNNIQLHHSTST